MSIRNRPRSKCCRTAALALLLTVPALQSAPAAAQEPLTTAFTYQGRLTDGGLATDRPHDFTFALFDAAGGGNQIGSTLERLAVPLSNGLFTIADLDFGVTSPPAFAGDRRWLQIGVRVHRDPPSGDYTPIAPRQELTATPYAIWAINGGPGGGACVLSSSDGTIIIDPNCPAADLIVNPHLNLGNTTPGHDGSLHVFNGQTPSLEAITADGAGGSMGAFIRLRDVTNAGTVHAYARGSYGAGMVALGTPGGSERVQLSAGYGTTNASSMLRLYGSNGGTPRVSLEGGNESPEWDNGGTLQLQNESGSVTAQMFGGADSAGGRLSLFNGLTTGRQTATLSGNYGGVSGGALQLWANSESETNNRVGLMADSEGTGAVLGLSDASGIRTVLVRASESGANGGALLQLSASQNNPTITLDANANGFGSEMTLSHHTGVWGVQAGIAGGAGGGYVQVYNNAGNTGVVAEARGSNGGVLALRGPDGAANRVTMTAETGHGSQIAMRAPSGATTVILDASDNDGRGGELALQRADGSYGIVLDTESGLGAPQPHSHLYMAAPGNVYTVSLSSGDAAKPGASLHLRDAQSANVETATLDARASVHPDHPECGSVILLNNGPGYPTMWLGGDTSNGTAEIFMYNGQTGNLVDDCTIDIDAGNTTVGGFMQFFTGVPGNNQRGLTMGAWDVPGNPNGGMIQVRRAVDGQPTITLNGGSGNICANEFKGIHSAPGNCADLAEAFEHSDPAAALPGMVMVIDAANPGKLTVSTAAYDKRVAGIISGAGDLKPGVKLGQRADGSDDLPLALAGRVYCYVDATEHAVEAGDLLTTSDTPGYAMKAADRERAFGCVLGKAMQPLAKGEKGLVLVLVSLQ